MNVINAATAKINFIEFRDDKSKFIKQRKMTIVHHLNLLRMINNKENYDNSVFRKTKIQLQLVMYIIYK